MKLALAMALAYALLVLTLPPNAQAGSIINAFMTKDIDNQKLVFHSKNGTSFHISFSDIPILSEHPKSYISLLNVIKKNKKSYLLLNVFFSSRSIKSIGRCAAGEEHYLVWMELDESQRISKAKEHIYSSCLLSLEIDQPINAYPPISIDALINTTALTIAHVFNNSVREIRYDVTLPEQGLTVIER